MFVHKAVKGTQLKYVSKQRLPTSNARLGMPVQELHCVGHNLLLRQLPVVVDGLAGGGVDHPFRLLIQHHAHGLDDPLDLVTEGQKQPPIF